MTRCSRSAGHSGLEKFERLFSRVPFMAPSLAVAAGAMNGTLLHFLQPRAEVDDVAA